MSSLFVYHGSEQKLGCLTPLQQTTYDPESKSQIPDGTPAVCATKSLEVAVFRSLINSCTCASIKEKYSSTFGLDKKGNPYFGATQETLDLVWKNKQVGYVHFFNINSFEKYFDEYRSYTPQVPVKIIQVSALDLPKNIKIIPAF